MGIIRTMVFWNCLVWVYKDSGVPKSSGTAALQPTATIQQVRVILYVDMGGT